MNSKEKLIFDCIDAHTQGNPVRLVKGPKPELKGSSMGCLLYTSDAADE